LNLTTPAVIHARISRNLVDRAPLPQVFKQGRRVIKGRGQAMVLVSLRTFFLVNILNIDVL